MAANITLYQWPPHAGLPSVTAACLSVEVLSFLILPDVQASRSCASDRMLGYRPICDFPELSSVSRHAALPAPLLVRFFLHPKPQDKPEWLCMTLICMLGVIPAVEKDSDIIAPSEPNDLAAARAILLQLAASGLDLDAQLTAAEKADALAYKQYIQSNLEPATQYTTWVESRGFKEFRKVPAPLLTCTMTYVLASP